MVSHAPVTIYARRRIVGSRRSFDRPRAAAGGTGPRRRACPDIQRPPADPHHVGRGLAPAVGVAPHLPRRGGGHRGVKPPIPKKGGGWVQKILALRRNRSRTFRDRPPDAGRCRNLPGVIGGEAPYTKKGRRVGPDPRCPVFYSFLSQIFPEAFCFRLQSGPNYDIIRKISRTGPSGQRYRCPRSPGGTATLNGPGHPPDPGRTPGCPPPGSPGSRTGC